MLRTIFGSIFTPRQTAVYLLLLAVTFFAVGLDAAPLSSLSWPRSPGVSSCAILFEGPPGQTRLEQVRTGAKAFGKEAAHYILDSNTRGDLNVLEMLYPQLNKTMTPLGAKRLAHILQNPFLSEAEIIERQKVIRAFAENSELRQSLRRHLERLQVLDDVTLQKLVTTKKPTSARGAALIAAAVTGGALAVGATRYMGGGEIGQVFQPLLTTALINTNIVNKVGEIRKDVLPYKNLITAADNVLAELSQASSEITNLRLINEITDMISAVSNPDHPMSVAKTSAKKLRRTSRFPLLMFYFDFLYGHSSWTLHGTQKAVLRDQEKLAGTMSALAELDVFLALAEVTAENRDSMVFPKIIQSAHAFLHIEDGHHPYLHANQREVSVANDATLSGLQSKAGEGFENLPNFTILTGPNAGGKSTYLKMIALNSIQGQIGAPVPAKAFVFTPIETLTNIDISDSVSTGKSFFRAEANRLAKILNRIESQPKILVVMDEILLGTNPKDRQAIEEEVIRWMAESGRMALLATHDIEMTRLGNEIPGVENLQVEEIQEADGTFRYSFRIKPGISQTSTAYEVLRAEGVPADLVERALRRRLGK